MSIVINSDLVMDAVRASNPQTVLLAKSKLGTQANSFNPVAKFQNIFASLTARDTPVKDLQGDMIAEVVGAADRGRVDLATAKLGDNESQPTLNVSRIQNPGQSNMPRDQSLVDQNQKFEAMILSNFVENLVPKATASLYGSGTAGEIWRSMQVDYMSQEMAKSGALGIAKSLNVTANLDQGSPAQMNRILPNGDGINRNAVAGSEWPYFKAINIQNRLT